MNSDLNFLERVDRRDMGNKLTFNNESIYEVMKVYLACDEVYGKVNRKSGFSYWRHIDFAVKSYLEDGFRDVNILKLLIAHDFIEEGLLLNFSEEDLCSRLETAGLNSLQIHLTKALTFHPSENKIKHLERILALNLNISSKLAIVKGYDVYDNSVNGPEFLSENSAKIKLLQADLINKYLSENKKYILKHIYSRKSSVDDLLFRLDAAKNKLDLYLLFF